MSANDASSIGSMKRALKETPNPGSDNAITQGCTCPILDNGHGNPELGKIRGWWITEGCPLHAPAGLPDDGKGEVSPIPG